VWVLTDPQMPCVKGPHLDPRSSALGRWWKFSEEGSSGGVLRSWGDVLERDVGTPSLALSLCGHKVTDLQYHTLPAIIVPPSDTQSSGSPNLGLEPQHRAKVNLFSL
jgi:hypothetical protein